MNNWEKNIRRVVPYTPGEQPNQPDMIKLNTNENPYPPSPKVSSAIKHLLAEPSIDRIYSCVLPGIFQEITSQVHISPAADKSVQDSHERDIYFLLSAVLREQDSKAKHCRDYIVIDPYAHLLSSFLL